MVPDMRLLVASHKQTWAMPGTRSGYATDGGFSTQIGSLAGLFDSTVLAVPVSRATPPKGLNEISPSVRVHPLTAPPKSRVTRRLASARWAWELAGLVRRSDAVHAPVPGDVGFLAIVVALLARKPLLVRHCATWDNPATGADRLLKWLLETRAGGRVVVLATGAGVDRPSSRNHAIRWVFSTAVTYADVAEGAAVRRSLDAATAVQLVTGGRLIPAKGAAIVIESFGALRSRGLVEHLHIVGDGPARESLEQLAASLGVESSVTFHGRLAHRGVLEVFDRSHLFVYPTQSNEGFPKLVLEALARGLPVVATAVSAIPSMIHGAGVVVTPDVSSVTKAVEEVIADGDRYKELSAAAIANAGNYTTEAWAALIGSQLEQAWGPLKHNERDLARCRP